MKCISPYSGADNLGDGVIQAGHEVILAIDTNEDACKTINLNHPDIEVINGKVSDYLESLPRCDAVIGGPPCPEHSKAKPNKTRDLCEVNNFVKAVNVTGAKYYFMENVPDLYIVYKARNHLINCADYGVPQTRIRRIFTNLNIPKPTHAKYPIKKLFGVDDLLWTSTKTALHLDDSFPYISNTGHNTQNRDKITRSINEPADTVTTASTMILTDYVRWSRKKVKNRISGQEGKKRNLTNEELAVLQGFRKDFKFYGGVTSVRRQIGNALPAIISKRFFEMI